MPVCLQPRVLPASCLPGVNSKGFPTLLPVSFVPAIIIVGQCKHDQQTWPESANMCVIPFGQCKHGQIRAFLGYYSMLSNVNVRFVAASGMGMAFVTFEAADGNIDEARRQCEAAYARAREMWTIVLPFTHHELFFHCDWPF